MISFFKLNISEISGNRLLRLYGGLLVFTHVLSVYFMNKAMYGSLTRGTYSYCWPFFLAVTIIGLFGRIQWLPLS